MAQPPCCMKVFSALVWMVSYSHDTHPQFPINCARAGTALAGVKMAGGNLPWEIDVDWVYAIEVNIQNQLLIKYTVYEKIDSMSFCAIIRMLIRKRY